MGKKRLDRLPKRRRLKHVISLLSTNVSSNYRKNKAEIVESFVKSIQALDNREEQINALKSIINHPFLVPLFQEIQLTSKEESLKVAAFDN